MADPQQLAILQQGVEAWNDWRKAHPQTLPDLSNADLRSADLRSADLRRADLSNANLRSANLIDANLCIAHLRSADLSYATLINANFTDADLSYAKLSYATLSNADLRRATLSNADLRSANLISVNLSSATLISAKLSSATLWATVFADVDLSTIEGLTTVKHHGPSSIGIDTIYRSQGKIPERFLREAGVPDSFLDYMHSLVGQAVQYFTCFISHSHTDQRFCDHLYADLRSHDVPSWYFPEDATWGKSVWGEIDGSIKVYDKLVVVCSQHSLQSKPVLREIERALLREDREGKHILFPIRIDDYLFQKWEHERKADVVSKVAGDFRGWRNADKYDKALQRFLKALKAQEEPIKT